MKKLLALAMLLVLCTVLTGLLTGCKVSVANTMMTDGVPKVAVTSPDVPVISTEWTERQYTVSEQDETVLLTARYQIPVLTLTGSPTTVTPPPRTGRPPCSASTTGSPTGGISRWICWTRWSRWPVRSTRSPAESAGKPRTLSIGMRQGSPGGRMSACCASPCPMSPIPAAPTPAPGRQAVSFDLSTGKTVSVTDLATDINQLEEAVYQLILRQIQDSGDTSYFSDYDKTVLDWIERSVFYNADGVTIVFNTYDIAPYSAGEQAFFIPYDLVKPYLNDYGLHLLELDT